MKSLLTALILCLSLLATPSLADSIFVEGHIRDLRSGVPIRGASVSLTDPRSASTHFPPETVGKAVITDDSGFFSIELLEEDLYREVLDILASCMTRRGIRQTDRLTQRVVLRPGTIRRDLYIDAFRSRRNRTCKVAIEFEE